MKHILTYPILTWLTCISLQFIFIFLTSASAHAQTTSFTDEEIKTDIRIVASYMCRFAEAELKSLKNPDDENARTEMYRALLAQDSITAKLVKKYENAGENEQAEKWVEEEMKKCKAFAELDNYKSPEGNGEPADSEMKRDMKKSMDLMCKQAEANLLYMKDSANANAKKEAGKLMEELNAFSAKMAEKYKDVKPDEQLMKWAEEEINKCKAFEETMKWEQEQQRINSQKQQKLQEEDLHKSDD